MRIAYLGDIVGTPGRQALTQQIAALRRDHGAELVIANAENVANGSGITPEQYRKLCEAGVDGMTLGDHAFRKQQIASTLGAAENLIRPMNLPGAAWGRGWMRLPGDGSMGVGASGGGESGGGGGAGCGGGGSGGGAGVIVVMLLGRLFMNSVQADDPFAALDRFLASLGNERAIVLVEIHAEATSEKVAMGWHANGRVAAVLGSHTHVPTADARLLTAPGTDLSLPGSPFPGVGVGTAYVTDLGMTGPADSVLGRRADRVLRHMSTALPAAFDVTQGNPRVQGVLIDIDPATRLATAIQRIDLPADPAAPPFTGR